MKIHHLNCGSLCPWAGKVASSLFPSKVACHCLLIESNDGLILVDSGLGKKDLEDPSRLGLMSHFLGIQKGRKDSAFDQVQKLGFSPKDVRHIIPTHLDLDHAGGIIDFPHASVHTLKKELDTALAPQSLKEKERYRKCQWSSDTKWISYEENYGEKWFAFDHALAMKNQKRIAELKRQENKKIKVFCSHDYGEFENFKPI